MALREFVDTDGRRWIVWDVYPKKDYHNRRSAIATAGPSSGSGWLAFECPGTGERRRLAPVPADWDTAADEDLCRLRDDAKMLPARPRLIE